MTSRTVFVFLGLPVTADTALVRGGGMHGLRKLNLAAILASDFRVALAAGF